MSTFIVEAKQRRDNFLCLRKSFLPLHRDFRVYIMRPCLFALRVLLKTNTGFVILDTSYAGCGADPQEPVWIDFGSKSFKTEHRA